jgi:hypothetical protein
MTPESCALQIALTACALLLAAVGAALLFRVAREDSPEPALDLTDARIRLGEGPDVLSFRLEVQPSGRASFRAETRPRTVPL